MIMTDKYIQLNTEKIPAVYKAGKKSMVDESKLLPTTVTGDGFVHLDDVSEIPHEVSIKTWSKNLLDINSTPVSLQGVEYTIDNSALIIKPTIDTRLPRIVYELKVKKNTTYAISGDFEMVNHEDYKGVSQFVIRTGAKNGSYLLSINLYFTGETTSTKKIGMTFNSGDYETLYAWFYFDTTVNEDGYGNSYAIYSDFQIEEGTVATPYVPYGETSASVTVLGRNLFDVSNLKATTGTYGLYPIPIPKWRLTLFDKDTSVDMTGVKYGIGRLVDGRLDAWTWFQERGETSDINRSTNGRFGELCNNLMIYPNNAETIEKITKRFDIMVTAETDIPYIYESYSSFEVTAPTTIKSVSPYMNFISNNPLEVRYNKSWGMQKAYDDHWDDVQCGGKRTNYYMAFCGEGWTGGNFKPKYPMLNLTECAYISHSSKITHFPILDLSNCSNTNQCFNSSQYLRYLEKIIVSNKTSFTGSTFNAEHITEIRFEGEIASSLSFVSDCLTKESIKSIFNALSTVTSGLTLSMRVRSVNQAFETSYKAMDGSTSSEWLNLIATRNNWTISLI